MLRRQWIEDRLAELRRQGDRAKTKRALAKTIGAHPARVTELIAGKRRVVATEAKKIAEFLGLPFEDVVKRLDHGPPETPSKPPAEISLIPSGPTPPFSAYPRDVPIVGAAAANIGRGSFHLNEGETIGFAPRPPGIADARNVYTVYVEGDSMEPRFFSGELIYVHPDRPPAPGCYVVVQQKISDHDPPEASVKRLIRRTASKLVLEQHNPKATIELALDRVVSLHRVLTTNELAGV